MQPGLGQHSVVPKEAAGSSPEVAATGRRGSSLPGLEIALEHPFCNLESSDS